jgi:predicted GNAT family N-acyltransferase
VVLKDETIVGVAKVAYYSLNARNENDLSISFCSIDKNYRGLGLSKLMTDAIFAEAARKNYEISTSSYTVLGKMYLQKSFNECAKKYNVVFHDMDEEDGLIDAEWMYVKMPDGKLLHNSEIEK